MRATRLGGSVRQPLRDRLDDSVMSIVVGTFRLHGADAEHVDHRTTHARDEPVEQFYEHLVVGGDDDRPVQHHVGVHVFLHALPGHRSHLEGTTNHSEVGGSSPRGSEGGGLDLDRGTRLDHGRDVGAAQYLFPIVGSIERRHVDPGPPSGVEDATTCQLANRLPHRRPAHTELGRERGLAGELGPQRPLPRSNALQQHIGGLDGHLIAPDLLQELRRDQIEAALKTPNSFYPGFWENTGWGYGVSIVTGGDRRGRFGWAGGLGTDFFVDPDGTICIVMTQVEMDDRIFALLGDLQALGGAPSHSR